MGHALPSYLHREREGVGVDGLVRLQEKEEKQVADHKSERDAQAQKALWRDDGDQAGDKETLREYDRLPPEELREDGWWYGWYGWYG